ncbi:hypothetical protein PHYSODRAFT_285660 [Phytophthora sojae]|uniref:RxLR effector protein n=2 Tax=Phytophthora sojae TaxID=67593 RepID=G4Z7Q7_PHYSP|nr:hypothetical protein PHYSODRAFT_285660 [Phytophthora sojae]AEK81300.1 Avh413 [Phytophthora sojae]AEK81301.1 Avh413 [Phytophthora sojae]AEK81302.1 Avh413 [Phytophthora sojae]EGZ21811.1 hypothetical protein PHYSODRAFT_285660 [Phytophthora sojae]|eukprot:XP_009524528.1 hypothetical protein PHYSODRAFT_285660 [Phytophthora sojae]
MRMRMHCALLLLGIIFIFEVSTTSTTVDKSQALIGDKAATATRHLRSYDFDDAEDGEERVNIPGLATAAELTSKIKSPSAQKLAMKMRLSSKDTPHTMSGFGSSLQNSSVSRHIMTTTTITTTIALGLGPLVVLFI